MDIYIVSYACADKEKTTLGCLFSEASMACQEANQYEMDERSDIHIDIIDLDLVPVKIKKTMDSKVNFKISGRFKELLESTRE